MKYSPLVTHVDGFLASQLGAILCFERAAKALGDAWSNRSEKDPMEAPLYWGAWALEREIARRWADIRDAGRLLVVHRQNGMWQAVIAEGGAA